MSAREDGEVNKYGHAKKTDLRSCTWTKIRRFEALLGRNDYMVPVDMILLCDGLTRAALTRRAQEPDSTQDMQRSNAGTNINY